MCECTVSTHTCVCKCVYGLFLYGWPCVFKWVLFWLYGQRKSINNVALAEVKQACVSGVGVKGGGRGREDSGRQWEWGYVCAQGQTRAGSLEGSKETEEEQTLFFWFFPGISSLDHVFNSCVPKYSNSVLCLIQQYLSMKLASVKHEGSSIEYMVVVDFSTHFDPNLP